MTKRFLLNENHDFLVLERTVFPVWPAVSIVLLLIMAATLPVSLLTGMNIYLLVLSIAASVVQKKPFDKNLILTIAPLFLIIAIASVDGVGADLYLYFKDIWYISNPAIVISIGFVLYKCMPNVSRGIRSFILGGVLLGLMHITKFILNPELLGQDANAIRQVVGTGYYAPALSLILLFAYRGRWEKSLKIGSWTAAVCICICTVAVVASFSRTIFIVVLIGFLCSFGVFSRNEIVRVGIVGLCASVLMIILQITVSQSSDGSTSSFIGKLARATDELTISEFSDIKSINLNWRGYETARALNYYRDGNPVQWVLGYGLGAEVDLGLAMPLGSSDIGEKVSLRTVPILHNGYAYILIKGGALSVLIFIFFLFHIYAFGRKFAKDGHCNDYDVLGRILQAIALTFGVTTWLISGVFNKLDLFPFFLLTGFVLAFLTKAIENKS